MNSSLLLSITTFVYGFAAMLYVLSWVFKNSRFGRWATWILFAGVIINTVGMGLRWIESYKLGIGHAPLSNKYESLVFFAWTIMVFYLFVEWRYKNRIIGAFTAPIAFLSMAYASLPSVSDKIQPLIPALKSNWLIAHVVTCFLGYAAFAIAFGISIMYLVKKNLHKQPSGYSCSRPGRTGRNDLSNGCGGFFILDRWYHNRICLGQFCLG